METVGTLGHFPDPQILFMSHGQSTFSAPKLSELFWMMLSVETRMPGSTVRSISHQVGAITRILPSTKRGEKWGP